MEIGFIGLGNVGAKLAGNLQASGIASRFRVLDLDLEAVAPFLAKGAGMAETPAALAAASDIVITCLPSPAACAAVVEGPDGLLEALGPGKVWIEMSTTDAGEVARLAEKVRSNGAEVAECPVSGGCHRAATGNIAILAGCTRPTFERILPVLTVLGRQVLHVGDIGTASQLKVLTNFLATANLVSLCEALTTASAAGLDLATTYEAIRISSGNSFVHETESQVILNGSRDISFTMDLVNKDIGLFQKIAEDHNVPLELSPLLNKIFQDGEARYGGRELSPNIIKRLEDATGLDIRAPGFPPEMVDTEPPARGAEVVVSRE